MAYRKITSATNPNIKRIVKLRDRQFRDDEGVTIVEGIREIARACEREISFKELYLSKPQKPSEEHDTLLKQCEGLSAPIYEVPKETFAKISYGNKKEGLLAVCEPRAYTFDDLETVQDPMFVIVEKIEKPGNLGAILRTCDGAGVTALFVCDPVTDLYNPNVIRSSLGTVFSVPIVVASSETVMNYLEEHEIKICAAIPHANVIYTQADLSGSLAVALGSEQEGLSEEWKNRADVQVRIPMSGQADSLNVSATAAIITYEALRQRTLTEGGENQAEEIEEDLEE